MKLVRNAYCKLLGTNERKGLLGRHSRGKEDDNGSHLENWGLIMWSRFIWLWAGCSSGLEKQSDVVSASTEGGEFLDRMRDSEGMGSVEFVYLVS
jgi:hypothetical protein